MTGAPSIYWMKGLQVERGDDLAALTAAPPTTSIGDPVAVSEYLNPPQKTLWLGWCQSSKQVEQELLLLFLPYFARLSGPSSIT